MNVLFVRDCAISLQAQNIYYTFIHIYLFVMSAMPSVHVYIYMDGMVRFHLCMCLCIYIFGQCNGINFRLECWYTQFCWSLLPSLLLMGLAMPISLCCRCRECCTIVCISNIWFIYIRVYIIQYYIILFYTGKHSHAPLTQMSTFQIDTEIRHIRIWKRKRCRAKETETERRRERDKQETKIAHIVKAYEFDGRHGRKI